MQGKLALTALALLAAPVFAAADPARYMPAELVAASMAPKPGSTILVGFRFTPKPGWHGYWSNPGDSGIAPTVTWAAPRGVSFGPLLHPAPSLITDSGISSFVHDGPHVLLSRMTIARSVAPGTPIPLTVKLNWAACTATQCVPLHATLALELVAGDGVTSADAAPLVAAAAKLPRRAPAGTFTDQQTVRTVVLPASLGLDAAQTRFFPDDNDAFSAASGKASKQAARLAIVGRGRNDAASIGGVVTDGRVAYRLVFNRSTAVPEPVESAASNPATQSPTVPVASIEPQAVTRSKPGQPRERTQWLPIAAIAFAALGTGALLLRRRTRHQRPRI